MFVGPTGVGKTELARALAEFMFDDESALIRLDMSEYSEHFNVSRMLGSPPGYVGYDEGGQLTEAVRRRPYSIVLFDEIEKAHPDIFNTLLQIFEDGRLTDAQGRVVDFKNTVIIMTSNIGTAELGKGIGFRANEDARGETDSAYRALKGKVMEAYNKGFRPELRNRIDEVIVFHHLNRDEIFRIVDLFSKRITDELQRREMKLTFLPRAKELLSKEGYDRQFGARPLRRAVQRFVEDPLSERILMGDFKAGDTIYVDAQNGEMAFTTEIPEDGGEVLVPVAEGGEGNETPSPDDEDKLNKLMSE
jgi:ATP-dependent Clp protease ATP-binding subunit ClpC